jgi:TetR/AcrR family transcriptional repressor of nem operon
MTDLVEHLGVGRQSLYDTFGDKRALYLAALDHYANTGRACMELPDDVPVRKQLRGFFTALIARAVGDPEHGCCMMVLAAAERAPADDEVTERFCSVNDKLEKVLVRRLARAQREGEIGSHHDVFALARFLSSSAFGLQLTARGVRDRRHLEQIADTTLSILG